MKRNSRLSSVLHALVHLVQHPDGIMTSEQLAACMSTNPVVVRRTMAGLREAGIVASTRGHNGGWTLARAPEQVTLADIYRSVGERLMLPTLATESPGCLVEQAVNGALGGFLAEAEAMLAQRLAQITLAQISNDSRALSKRFLPHAS